ncbi:SgcJ/EcaC family oxidoreductase [Micromonospora sp. PLK6-60]|uniref:SgcJ/EcaC family oxidoreductase n=1 Tax=Micromonospora sp. PLK6-60 TaxID=2873383 RepID=UPI001CA72D5F|nr:SgcJ/EcaC family oxidoreductase [Micromonospora sp. PLK6-60]MBY8870791.1 SgcJ/EcaC family oxidoreductase [Micromonospora sp. PLK6-60]
MTEDSSSWGDAGTMLATAGVAEDQSYYRQFTGADEKAALTIGQRIQAAWAANDADAFAEVFAENGSLLLGDEQLTSREEIRAYMAKGFAGPLRGARVTGWPLAVTFLNDDAAFLVTQGGIMYATDDELLPQREIRAVWVIARRAPGVLELMSHQGSPIRG